MTLLIKFFILVNLVINLLLELIVMLLIELFCCLTFRTPFLMLCNGSLKGHGFSKVSLSFAVHSDVSLYPNLLQIIER